MNAKQYAKRIAKDLNVCDVEYLDSCREVEWIFDNHGNCLGGLFYLEIGEPTVLVDTRLGTVLVRMGGVSHTERFSNETLQNDTMKDGLLNVLAPYFSDFGVRP